MNRTRSLETEHHAKDLGPCPVHLGTKREATKPVERWERQLWGAKDGTTQDQEGQLQLLPSFRKDCLWMLVQHKRKPSVLRANLGDMVTLIHLNF